MAAPLSFRLPPRGKRPFAGKTIVVTGASAGIGRAIVRAFAREGADLALLARGRDGLAAAAREVEAEGGRALAIPLDVADAAAVLAAGERIERELGPVAVWVNDAMVSVLAPIDRTTPEEYRRVTEVTYLGYVHGTLAALRAMRPRDAGKIVQVGTALAYRGIPLQSAYCAAKHAVQGFTDSLRCELAHDRSGITVTMIELPAVNTPQFTWIRSRMPRQPQPVPPFYQPEVIADAVVWAASRRRREVYVGFATVLAIVANRIAGGFLDWYLGRAAYRSQQGDAPLPPGRPDNLWHPLPGDAGAHGPFDAKSRAFSFQFWLTRHRGAAALVLALLAAAAFLAWRQWKS